MNTQLSLEMQKVKEKTNKELERFFDLKIKQSETVDAELAEMARILKEFTLRGGKRVRAFLVWCGYFLAGGKDENKVLKACAAVEMLHHFLLAVDDTADRDVLRHGGPTLEVIYQQALNKLPEEKRFHYARSFSEITAALLHTYVFEIFSESGFDTGILLEGMKVLTKTMFEDTAAGWKIHMHQNWQSLADAEIPRFMKGLQLVSAQYTFVGPIHLGVILAGKGREYGEIVRRYGLNVGTAFQIQDDVLGLFGKPEETGKAVGNDVREGKKTLLVQYAYSHSSSKDDKKFLEKSVGNPLTETQLKRVQDIVKKTGSLEYSRKVARQYVTVGTNALNQLPKNTPYVEELNQLAEFVIAREK